MNISTFDRHTLKTMRQDIDTALNAVSTKYGVSLKTGNARFSSKNFTMKLEASILNSNGQAQTKEALNLEQYKSLDGLKFSLGDTFKSNGRSFRVTGYKPSRRKYPISAECVTSGKGFKFPLLDVNRNF